MQSDQVEQLATQAEEAVVEVANIEALVQAFHGKVYVVEQADLEPLNSQ